MAGLTILRGGKATHPGDAASQIDAVAFFALVLIAYKRCPVGNNPIRGVLPGDI